jgi:Ca2+-transporting ATPase
MLIGAVAASAVLTLAGLYLPPLAELLHTQPLPAQDLLVVLVAALVPALVYEALKARRRRSLRRG